MGHSVVLTVANEFPPLERGSDAVRRVLVVRAGIGLLRPHDLPDAAQADWLGPLPVQKDYVLDRPAQIGLVRRQ